MAARNLESRAAFYRASPACDKVKCQAFRMPHASRLYRAAKLTGLREKGLRETHYRGTRSPQEASIRLTGRPMVKESFQLSLTWKGKSDENTGNCDDPGRSVEPAGSAQQAQLYDDRPKISFNGEAVVYVKPDKIVVTFGIQTLDKDIQQAKKLNNDILKKAVAAIKEGGVPEKEIQTDHLSIEPRYDDRYGARNTSSATLFKTPSR